MPLLNRTWGRNLTYAKPLWDWLYARRLTILCLRDAGTWQDPSHPPLLRNGNWKAAAQAV